MMILQVHGLFKTYPGSLSSVSPLADVSFDVSAGEFLAICGRSGSGKSTLMAILAGLTRPSSGTVTIDGTELYSLRQEDQLHYRRTRIGVVLQFTGLLPTLRTIDNVAFPALVAGTDDGIDPYHRAAELLAQVGLADRMEAFPHQLSGGEQRRAALARALINRPPLLFCDEPTNDLDATTASEVLSLLLELHDRHRTTLVVVTHDENLARHADRIVTLDGGRVVSACTSSMPRSPASLPGQIVPVPSKDKSAATPLRSTERLGDGSGSLLTQFVLALALGACAVAAVDWATEIYRRQQHDSRVQARQVLEQAALQQLRADVDRLSLSTDADGAYTFVLYLQNLNSEAPVYVTMPSVRAFVQVDRDWIEVPIRSLDSESDGVVALNGRQLFRFTVQPDVARYTELVQGYMHVRFSNAMLISRDPSGASGLFERTDDYYVYLKPHHANDAEICLRNQWTSAPLWIGMPPH